jgi:polysaccharide deacetylase 2 family uncharacterized protein YibQ
VAIALPRFKAVRLDIGPVLKTPAIGLAGAAVLFAGALYAVASLIGAIGGGETGLRVPLAETLGGAPAGWRAALKPAHGPLHAGADVVWLSEHPAATGAAKPAHAPPPITFAEGGGLPAAPMAGFYAPGPGGPLPIIAADGRTPAQVYARPFKSTGRPKVSLVVGGLGLNARTTRQAIDTLRPEITLAFSAYSPELQTWIDLARSRGHEVLLETPMEPLDFPDNDPGPYALMAEAPSAETVKRLEWVLSRASGYFGLTNYLGSRFLADDQAYGVLASALRARGVAFVDDGSAAAREGGIDRASAGHAIDDNPAGPAIEQQLAALEASASQRGQALGAGFAYPITLEKVAQWANAVEQRGFQLAPASALTHRR